MMQNKLLVEKKFILHSNSDKEGQFCAAVFVVCLAPPPLLRIVFEGFRQKYFFQFLKSADHPVCGYSFCQD